MFAISKKKSRTQEKIHRLALKEDFVENLQVSLRNLLICNFHLCSTIALFFIYETLTKQSPSDATFQSVVFVQVIQWITPYLRTYRKVEQQAKVLIKIWLFSFYFPARSFCLYHSTFSCWKLLPKKEQRQKQLGADKLVTTFASLKI